MHVIDLEPILPPQFRGNLSKAEKRMVHAATIGEFAYCSPSEHGGKEDDLDPANDPTKAGGWGPEREIRAELIRWLCLGEDLAKAVDPSGLQIYAARITGKLELAFANVPFPLTFRRCCLVPGNSDQHISADLRFVTIPGIYWDGSSTESLKFDGADVKGDMYLGFGFSALGPVSLTAAKIGGSLSGWNGTFKNPGDVALHATRANVKGNVILKKASVEGEVRLTGAQIGENLYCSVGTFSAVNLEAAAVKGIFFWHRVNLERKARGESTILNLTNATVGALSDDEDSWPDCTKGGQLMLDGFIYGRITELSDYETRHNPDAVSQTPTDAKTRLEWLNRPGNHEPVRPQPYLQLAKVLREMGDDAGAKQVLFELEKRSRKDDRGFKLVEDAVSRATVGYGVYPGRAVWWACGLAALGWIIHRRAYRMGAMVPTDKDACDEFCKGQVPAHYQPFNPLIYSIENCIPLVKLGQDDAWRADPRARAKAARVAGSGFRRVMNSVLDWMSSPVTLRWFRWIMIALGWLLATFFGAALSGFLKS